MEDLNHISRSQLQETKKFHPSSHLLHGIQKIIESHTRKCSNYSLIQWSFTTLLYRVWEREDFSKEVVYMLSFLPTWVVPLYLLVALQ